MKLLGFLVEATGIEPVSENPFTQLSPGGVYLLRFPSMHADKQAYTYGSYPVMTKAVASLCSRSPLIDALSQVAVVKGRTRSTN